MAKIRSGIACGVLILLASACGQATLSTDNESTSQDDSSIDANESNETSQADEPEDEPIAVVESEEDETVTEEEIEASELAAAADDVEVRLVDAPLATAGGSSVIRAEVLGVDGDIVSAPALSIIGPGVVFTSVPDGCEVSDGGVDCVSDTFLFRDSDDIPVNETMTLQFDFEYSVPADIEFPLVFELTATSRRNPVENDPDPSNNIITVEVEPATDDTPAAEEEPEVDDSESTVTEDEVISAEVRDARDDVAVRLVEATPVSAGGSSSLSAEVFAVLGIHGDAFVVLPSLNVTASQSVEFTSVPDGCTVTATGVECAVDTATVAEGIDSTVETDALLFEFEYSVSADVELPLVFELSASSFNNPVENDPDPSNNTITVEVEAG